jgi:glycine betaine/proline transport system ATP-binding protein
LSSEAAVSAQREKLPLADVVVDMPTVKPDTLISDIMPIIYDAQTPVAVIDDDNRLRGVIIRGAVLKALADTEGDSDDNA